MPGAMDSISSPARGLRLSAPNGAGLRSSLDPSLPTIVLSYSRSLREASICGSSEWLFFSCSNSDVTGLHTENFFRNVIKSNRNQIVFTIFRLI